MMFLLFGIFHQREMKRLRNRAIFREMTADTEWLMSELHWVAVKKDQKLMSESYPLPEVFFRDPLDTRTPGRRSGRNVRDSHQE